MSKTNKKLIISLLVLCVLLVTVTVWLVLHRISPEKAPAPTATPQPAAATPTATPGTTGGIIINEFMEKNRAVLRDEDGEFSDWIELYNPTDVPVSLEGWSISDSADKEGWSFPEVTMESGEYLLVFASGKDKSTSQLHTDFALSGDEGVYLRDGTGAICSEALCGNCRKDVSMALSQSGDFEKSLYPTPGFINSAEGYMSFQQTLSAPGPLAINEVMVSNTEYLWQVDLGYCDWVEIKNLSSEDIFLADYYLSDDKDDFFLWQLPEVTLGAGQMLTVLCDGNSLSVRDGLAFSNFSLDSENEQLYLSYKSGAILDYASLRDIPYEGSYGREPGESGWYYYNTPTPGAENSGGERRVSETPRSAEADGVFNNVGSVSVELQGEGEIRYTLDGSTPGSESELYTAPLTLTETTVLRAVSIEEGALPSRPLTLSYIINEGHTLPVVSLCADNPTEFLQMYDSGDKTVELPGSLSYYGEDGSFSIGCGITMNGMTSLTMEKKNMALRFRGSYGDSALDYDLYGGGVTEFTNLLLRVGQDYESAIVRNELCQQLCSMATDKVINQRSKFVILYVNGEYYGIYNLKEKANEQLYASIAGVSRDSVTLYEPPIPFESDFYEEIIKFCIMNDMSLPENYQHVADQIDMDSLIDFLIMEGFCSNTDISSGNMRFVRSSENDNKWRVEFYDLDSTFLIQGSVYYNLMSDYAENHVQVSAFIVPLMDNAEFRDKFLTRADELMGTVLTNETVLSTLDSLAEEIAPEVERDVSRYGRTVEQWQWNLNYIHELIDGCNWRQYNIDVLSELFALSADERAQYFGDIDGK